MAVAAIVALCAIAIAFIHNKDSDPGTFELIGSIMVAAMIPIFAVSVFVIAM